MTPSTEWKELVADGEQAHLEELAQRIRAVQRRAARDGKTRRALHAKQQASVEAEFEVLDSVPEYARVGPFASPRTFQAWVRFSNGDPGHNPDKKPDVRGLAIKLVGVEGRKVIPGLEDAKTQDFLLIRTPSTPLRDADEFVWLIEAASAPALLPLKALLKFGPARGFRMVRQILKGLGAPMTSAATTRYFSALPIRFGAYAAKYALEPHATGETDSIPKSTPNWFGAELGERLAKGPVTYDFRVQFFKDEASTPIEDASKEWSETDAPFVTVARLTLPQQDLSSTRGEAVAKFIDTLSFDPWHCVEELRPVGNMMRARNAAYRLSGQERGAAGEPDGTELLDESAA